MDHEILLKKIAGRLSGIHQDDFSTAERQIARLLADNGFLHIDDQGNVLDADFVRPETGDTP